MSDKIINIISSILVISISMYFWKVTLILMTISSFIGFIILSIMILKYFYNHNQLILN